MIIYKIKNVWNFDSFPNRKILKICYFSKFQKFDDSRNCKIWEIFEIFIIANFWNFPNRKCFNLEYFRLEIFGIIQIGKLTDFYNLSNLKNRNLFKKIGKFGIVRLFDIPHYSQFCQFSYLPFDINQFSQF